MADFQKDPIREPSSNIIVGNGGEGVFICTPGTPFVAANLTGENAGKIGAAIKLTSDDGANPVIASITANGAIGDTSVFTSLVGWLVCEGMGIEVEELTMTSGMAWVYLKRTVQTAQIDTTPSLPEFLSATTNSDGTEIEMTFSKAMADPAGEHAAFTFDFGGNSVTSSAVALKSGDNTTFVFSSLNYVIQLDWGQGTAAYTPGTVQDTSANLLAAFTSKDTVNNAIQSISTVFTWDDITVAGDEYVAYNDGLMRTSGTNGYVGHFARSKELIYDGQAASLNVSPRNNPPGTRAKTFGLGKSSIPADQNALNYSLSMNSAGALTVFEDGVTKLTGAYLPSDFFRIRISGTTVLYEASVDNVSWDVFYVSLTPASEGYFCFVGCYYPLTSFVTNWLKITTKADPVESILTWDYYVGPYYPEQASSYATYLDDGLIATGAGAAYGRIARSIPSVGPDQFVTANPTNTTQDRAIGLSKLHTPRTYDNLKYCLRFNAGATVDVFEDGVNVLAAQPYTATEFWRIKISGTTVTYDKSDNNVDWSTVHTSAIAASEDYYAFTDFSDEDDVMTDLKKMEVIASGVSPVLIKSNTVGDRIDVTFNKPMIAPTLVPEAFLFDFSGTIITASMIALNNYNPYQIEFSGLSQPVTSGLGAGLASYIYGANPGVIQSTNGDTLASFSGTAIVNNVHGTLTTWQNIAAGLTTFKNGIRNVSGLPLDWANTAVSIEQTSDSAEFVLTNQYSDFAVGFSKVTSLTSYTDMDYALVITSGDVYVWGGAALSASFGAFNFTHTKIVIDGGGNVSFYKSYDQGATWVLINTHATLGSGSYYAGVSLTAVGDAIIDVIVE